MKRVKRKATPQAISDVLQQVVENINEMKKQDIFVVLASWQEIAGKRFYPHTRPASLKKGVLKVFVDTSAWFYQANMEKAAILKAAQKKMGTRKVKSIEFRIGSFEKTETEEVKV
jgi:predicted nucleic acid-binding Zn ribbon protein